MKLPKRYGMSREDECPFCGKKPTTKNSQGFPVCTEHKSSQVEDKKCSCGRFLELRTGKFGVFYNCIKCGNMSVKKAFEMDEFMRKRQEKKDDFILQKEPEHVMPDDPRYFD